jgi:3-oxoacyl-[acyl-carrier protein] reductase
MELGLRGKRALVTGGTRGIGRAIVETLADEGCDVALCARSEPALAEAVAALAATGVRALGRALDVGALGALEGFVDAAARELGGLDVFVSNVSAAMGGGNDEAAWRRGFEVDVLATVRGCEAAIPHLVSSGAGAIVLVSTASVAEPLAGRRAYDGVKAALMPYAKSLARQLAPQGVRCNVVSPGTIYFPGGIWQLAEERAPERFRDALARNPMGRMGTPQEVANAVVFLASPRASFVSGTNLMCDGARTQRVQY